MNWMMRPLSKYTHKGKRGAGRGFCRILKHIEHLKHSGAATSVLIIWWHVLDDDLKYGTLEKLILKQTR